MNRVVELVFQIVCNKNRKFIGMKVAGFEIENKINPNNVDLFLNGVAIRSKFFIQTYIILTSISINLSVFTFDIT